MKNKQDPFCKVLPGCSFDKHHKLFFATRRDLFFFLFFLPACPGIRLLDGSVTDAMEATALTFNIHLVDVYVCSWGPRDDGAEMDGPQGLTEKALRLGIRKA